MAKRLGNLMLAPGEQQLQGMLVGKWVPMEEDASSVQLEELAVVTSQLAAQVVQLEPVQPPNDHLQNILNTNH
jgi:hypothetical protein